VRLPDQKQQLPKAAGSTTGIRARICLLSLSLLLAAVLGETVLRVCFHERLAWEQDERNLTYRYDQELGWFPIPNSSNRFTGSRTVSIQHNRLGFRGAEPARNGKPGILFLGDSFVWGFDAEASERFTEKLQTRHPEWNIYNLGVSGYGTDQEYLLLQKYFEQYQPQVVFLMFCTDNDDSDNCWNVRGGYYKPYVTLDGTRLRLNGIPVPRAERVFCGEHPRLCRWYLVRVVTRAWFRLTAPAPLKSPNPTGPILRDMQKYAQGKGAAFVVGVERSQPYLEEFLRYFKIPYVDVTTSLRYPSHGGHWTPEGHTFVCDKIDEFLVQGKYAETANSKSPE